jgi:hypothetical protein
MDRNQAKEFYPILQAFAEGRVIECRTKPNTVKGSDIPNDWTEMKEIEYWNNTEYRIKPEPKYRPFKDAEECWQEMLKHQPFGWIYSGSYYSIVSISNETVNIVNDTRDIIDCLFSEMIEEGCTFVDGLPFGVKVEE